MNFSTFHLYFNVKFEIDELFLAGKGLFLQNGLLEIYMTGLKESEFPSFIYTYF
jgi:hypothetical protein